MLDGLMSRPVFANADGVVGSDINDRKPHDRRQPNRWLHIIGEHEEGASEWPEATVRSDSVEAGGHAVLSHSPVERAAGSGRAEVTALLERGPRAAAKIRRAPDQVGHCCGNCLECQA